ncbi:MAG: ATP-binding protein [Pseudomonadota bacterium]
MLDTAWVETPLGPLDQWPLCLRVAVGICLNSRSPMFVWWGEQAINIYNDAYIPVLGKRHPEAFGRPAQQVWHDIWPVLQPQVEAVMQRGEATWNERQLLVMERNGYTEETFFTWSYSPIYDEHGVIRGLHCACTEETPRVLAERERDALIRSASDSAEVLQTWFDNSPGFVALLRGPEFVFELANRAYYQLVGHRELIGLPVWQALPEVKNQGFEELLRHVYENGEPFTGRALPVAIQAEQGGPVETHLINLSYEPVRDPDGRVVGIFVQGYDVTEQIRAVEALEQADRRKDEFLATLAHELRNPMAPVRHAVTVAKMPTVTPDKRAWALDVIDRQSQHMGLLLDDLLDVARISQGRLELRCADLALSAVLDAAVETARPLIDARRHRLTVHPSTARVWADPLRLAQVVSNLLSNAAKYTDDGGTIDVQTLLVDNQIRIRVSDNGIGMTPESQADIFGMFSQATTALSRAHGGLGIGLSLSRGLIQLHGGTLEVESAGLGQGSTFTIALPVHQVVEADPALALPSALPESAPEVVVTNPASATALDAPPASMSVLIADDNTDALESLAELLAMYGYTVHTATDGHSALEAAGRCQPRVVVLDIGMPGLNGYDTAKALRQREGGTALRLIALTGWGQAEDRRRAQAAGFDHHCTKPVDIEELMQLINA